MWQKLSIIDIEEKYMMYQWWFCWLLIDRRVYDGREEVCLPRRPADREGNYHQNQHLEDLGVGGERGQVQGH